MFVWGDKMKYMYYSYSYLGGNWVCGCLATPVVSRHPAPCVSLQVSQFSVAAVKSNELTNDIRRLP